MLDQSQAQSGSHAGAGNQGLPRHAPVPPRGRQGNPAQGPEQDFLPDQQRRARMRPRRRSLLLRPATTGFTCYYRDRGAGPGAGVHPEGDVPSPPSAPRRTRLQAAARCPATGDTRPTHRSPEPAPDAICGLRCGGQFCSVPSERLGAAPSTALRDRSVAESRAPEAELLEWPHAQPTASNASRCRFLGDDVVGLVSHGSGGGPPEAGVRLGRRRRRGTSPSGGTQPQDQRPVA